MNKFYYIFTNNCNNFMETLGNLSGIITSILAYKLSLQTKREIYKKEIREYYNHIFNYVSDLKLYIIEISNLAIELQYNTDKRNIYNKIINIYNLYSNKLEVDENIIIQDSNNESVEKFLEKYQFYNEYYEEIRDVYLKDISIEIKYIYEDIKERNAANINKKNILNNCKSYEDKINKIQYLYKDKFYTKKHNNYILNFEKHLSKFTNKILF